MCRTWRGCSWQPRQVAVSTWPAAVSFVSDVNMFADDTEIHFSHSDLLTVERTLQADM